MSRILRRKVAQRRYEKKAALGQQVSSIQAGVRMALVRSRLAGDLLVRRAGVARMRHIRLSSLLMGDMRDVLNVILVVCCFPLSRAPSYLHHTPSPHYAHTSTGGDGLRPHRLKASQPAPCVEDRPAGVTALEGVLECQCQHHPARAVALVHASPENQNIAWNHELQAHVAGSEGPQGAARESTDGARRAGRRSGWQ